MEYTHAVVHMWKYQVTVTTNCHGNHYQVVTSFLHSHRLLVPMIDKNDSTPAHACSLYNYYDTSVIRADECYCLSSLVHGHPVDLFLVTTSSSWCHAQLGQSTDKPAHPILQVGMACLCVRTNQTWPKT